MVSRENLSTNIENPQVWKTNCDKKTINFASFYDFIY